MPNLASILGLLTLGRSLGEHPMFRQLLSGMAAVVTLTITIGMMVGALLLGGLYGFYLMLISHGLDQTSAIETLVGVTVLVIALLTIGTISYLRRLFDLPRLFQASESPLLANLHILADSFADGLLTRPPAKQAGFKPVVVASGSNQDE